MLKILKKVLVESSFFVINLFKAIYILFIFCLFDEKPRKISCKEIDNMMIFHYKSLLKEKDSIAVFDRLNQIKDIQKRINHIEYYLASIKDVTHKI